MMFNKFAVFALLALTVLVVQTIGHPTEEVASGIEETASTVKHGIRGWLKNVHAKIAKHEENCTHGGVIRWVKSKLGLTKKSTTETPTTTTTTTTTTPEETDYSSGYVPITSVVNQGEPAEEGYAAASPDDDVTMILDDSSVTETENDSGNESADAVPTYPSVADNVVDPADPEIDVRGQF
ncbi:uncharacterized protein LOC132946397 [Metopolophium dirhodum]|uniref:uncharacterized protein LOC132946397 n=1 Tax=Metopolophium dirhodum TaxID=44670 RepID=UPI00298F5D6C|nr:uncharacterized protein LOC132946397 [Metopolophium dirhodum]